MRGKGEGSVYQRADGKWVAQIDAGVDPKTGTRRRPKRIRSSKQAAVRALTDLRREYGTLAALEGLTVGEWLEWWLHTVVAPQVKAGTMAPKTAVGYESHVRVHLKPRIGHIRLDRLTPGDVDSMVTKIIGDGRKPRTARHVRATLSTALSAAIRNGKIRHNVAKQSGTPKTPSREPSAFSRDEMERIIAECRRHVHGPLYLFIGLTGMRTSEAVGLRWSDVDLDTGTYVVTQGMHRIPKISAEIVGQSGMVTSKPKTDGSGATTPLAADAVALLRWHRRQLLARGLYQAGGLVFPSANGTPIMNVGRMWTALLKRAKVPAQTRDGRGRGVHELRRTFATRMRDLGVPLEEVQRLGRWTNPQTLLAFYRALDEQRLREAAEKSGGGLDWSVDGGDGDGPEGSRQVADG